MAKQDGLGTDKKVIKKRKLDGNENAKEARVTNTKKSLEKPKNTPVIDSPPIPPPQLIDLVHNFLRDFKYVKAAHGVRTDNQQTPGHSMSIWKSKSEGMPSLLDLFLQWQEQNAAMDIKVGVADAKPQPVPKTANTKVTKGSSGRTMESSSSSSDSESDDDSESSLDEADKSVRGSQAPLVTSNRLKRKASEVSETSEGESHSDSSSTSSSSSSDSAAKVKERPVVPANLKQRDSVTNTPTLVNGVNNSSMSSSSSSDSGSSSGSSESSDSSDSSESSGSERTAPKTSVKITSAAKESLRTESDSSTTLGAPENQTTATEEAKAEVLATYSSDSASEPSSASSLGSQANFNSSANADVIIAPAKPRAKADWKGDILVFNAPLSKRARQRGEVEGEQKVIQATANNFKMLKKQRIPYSRIPSDIKVDEKFNSNAYQPYDYANKAYQDLSITKGKGFTKAKQKGKRGSYRGGMIDTSGGRGIKFEG